MFILGNHSLARRRVSTLALPFRSFSRGVRCMPIRTRRIVTNCGAIFRGCIGLLGGGNGPICGSTGNGPVAV